MKKLLFLMILTSAVLFSCKNDVKKTGDKLTDPILINIYEKKVNELTDSILINSYKMMGNELRDSSYKMTENELTDSTLIAFHKRSCININ